MGWSHLPEYVLLDIFSELSFTDMFNVALVCKRWENVFNDELLWKKFFLRDFQVNSSIPLAPGRKSWRKEYQRLVNQVPIVETEILQEHQHQVLHVSFSHNGKSFATCSKDGYIIVWTTEYPATVEYSKNMNVYSWKYTQFSQFNSTDTLLLVSGVHFGTLRSTSGEIAVFNLEKNFQLQCRVQNKPYDIFGTWYNDNYLLSGDLSWLAQMGSATHIWMNKSSQEASSEHEAILNRLYKFYNTNASSVRTIMIAKCLNAPLSKEENDDALDANVQEVAAPTTPPVAGNPPSGTAFPKASYSNNDLNPGEKSHVEYRSPILYTDDYRKVEQSASPEKDDPDEKSNNGNFNEQQNYESDDNDGLQFASPVTLEEDCDKYLIFTTGSKTYSPHQIGFKRIKKFDIPTKMTVDIDIKERVEKLARLKALRTEGLPPGWEDPESISRHFDKIDHCIDLDGHIIGMGLSPDHRYLYVNTRPWPNNYVIDNPLQPPSIAQEIDIHVIDLVTLKEVGTMLRSHKAFTKNESCFFIFLDASHEYVASGAEDKHGYIWDRHYGMCVARLPHTDVVNAVAFNPVDPEYLVSVGDDFLIKVWRSKRRAKQLDIKYNDTNIGHELRLKHQTTEVINL